MSPHCCNYLQIHIAADHTFFITQKLISSFSERFRRILKQYRRPRRRTHAAADHNCCAIQMDEFPGGAHGFELVSRFCHNNGSITITVSNVALLHCCAVFLGMTEQVSTCNLIQQTEMFLDGIFHWPWSDIISCLHSCESFFTFADSSGLLQKLVCSVLAKIAQNLNTPSSSSSSSPEGTSGSRSSMSTKSWWFEDMAVLPAKIVEKVVQGIGGYGSDNKSLILTRFVLHYLQSAAQSQSSVGVGCGYGSSRERNEYGGLADTAVHGVIEAGKSKFSCRGLFWVLRIVCGFGVSKECRGELERVIGGMLDQAKLDDLLISGSGSGSGKCIYDVNLVIRLVRVFVNSDAAQSIHQLNKVGKLVDKYLCEISPDQNLKMSKFVGVAESLPDCARDCFDGVYRAIDIYLESHPNLSMEERCRICRCINQEKLSLEACKALARNTRVPPRIAVEALMCQHYSGKMGGRPSEEEEEEETQRSSSSFDSEAADHTHRHAHHHHLKQNLQKMQWRVVELEKVCSELRSNMSTLVNQNVTTSTPPPPYHRALPRLC